MSDARGNDDVSPTASEVGGSAMDSPGAASTVAIPDNWVPPDVGAAVRYFGEYLLFRELAKGGMGVVWEARQTKLDRVVALKMMLKGDAATEIDIARFIREAHAAAALDHPNIVPIFEIAEHEGQPYFSMAYMRGGSLKQRINDGPLPPKEAAALLRQIAEAVQFAHERGVIHRDLKPHNILLDRDGTPKLTDFGLAKRLNDDSELTKTGAIMGTPSFMPPEQASGEMKRVGPAADIYSLGATLYALLVGRPPFQAATSIETLRLVLHTDPAAPRQLNPAIPRDLETIALKCLAKEPTGRYATAAALAEDLRRFLADEPILARPTPMVVKAWKWVRRNAAVAVSLMVALATLTAATVVSVGFAARATVSEKKAEDKAKEAQNNAVAATAANAQTAKQLDRAESLVYVADIQAAQRYWEEGNVAAAHERLAACAWDRRGWEHDYLWTTFNRGQLTLRGHVAPVNSVAWSADGTRLATGSDDGTAKIWDARSGANLLTLTGHTDWVRSVAWSVDGARLATGGGDSTAKVWDARSGAEIRTLKGHNGPVLSAAWSADGVRLATGSWDQTANVWDARSGAKILTLKGHDNLRYQDIILSVAWSADGTRLAAGGGDTTAKVWDARCGAEFLSLKGHSSVVNSVAWSADGTRLATVGDSTAKVWNARSGAEILTLKGHTKWVDSVAWSADGTRLATASSDNTAKIWDARCGAEFLTVKGHTETVKSVAWSADGTRLATASSDRTAKVWDARIGTKILTLQGHTDAVTSVAWSADGARLATGSDDNIAKIWDARSGAEILTIKGHRDWVKSVAWSADDARLATGSYDDTAKVWDAHSGAEILTLKGRWSTMASVAWSADGARLATGSRDNTAKVWDARSAAEVLTINGHSNEVTSTAWSADGARLATRDMSGTVKVWSVATGRELPEKPDWPFPLEPAVTSPDSKWKPRLVGSTIELWPTVRKPQHIHYEKEAWAESARPKPEWHKRRAAECEKDNQWFAAACHWRWVAKLEPSNAEAKAKLAAAEAKWAAEQAKAPPPAKPPAKPAKAG